MPWQMDAASERGLRLDKHFAHWIKDDTLRVGTPGDPYAFSPLVDQSEYPVDVSPSDYERVDEPQQLWDRKAEGTPMNMDDDGKGGIPPA